MHRSLLPVLCFLACTPPETSLSPPPQGGLVVSVPDLVFADEEIELEVSGAEPFAEIRFYWAFRSDLGADCPVALRGGCLDLISPRSPFVMFADEFGTARRMMVAPDRTHVVWAQAASVTPTEVRISEATPVDIRTKDADVDDDFIADWDEVTIWGTDPRLPDTDGDGALDGVELLLDMDPFITDCDGDGILDGDDPRPWTEGPTFAPPATDVVVSDPNDVMLDPEFDDETQQFVWQEANGSSVWVGDIDPQTGDFIPQNGRGTLIDTNVTRIADTANGPEWIPSQWGPIAVYAKPVEGAGGNVRNLLWYAAETSPGVWSNRRMEGGTDASTIQPSNDPLDPNPRVVFTVRRDGVQSHTGWREVFDETASGTLLVESGNNRWVPGERKIIGKIVRPISGSHVVVQDVDTGGVEVITDDEYDYSSPFMWNAPELGGEQVMFAARGLHGRRPTEVVVYRKRNGRWRQVHLIRPPPRLPYVDSPEPIVSDGRSYVVFTANDRPPKLRASLAEVWISSVLPDGALIYRVSDDTPAGPPRSGSLPRRRSTLDLLHRDRSQPRTRDPPRRSHTTYAVGAISSSAASAAVSSAFGPSSIGQRGSRNDSSILPISARLVFTGSGLVWQNRAPKSGNSCRWIARASTSRPAPAWSTKARIRSGTTFDATEIVP